MKKTILLFLLIGFLEKQGISQTVNGIPIKDVGADYIQIKGSPGPLFSNKIQVLIDFGQANKALSTKEEVILDSTGKRLQFNSMIDALNFMDANNYEFVQAYGVSISNKDIEHYFIMKKKKG